MYDPIADGIRKKTTNVAFNNVKPPDEWREIVHSFWELRTTKALDEDFVLHVIPDACVNILLNLKDPKIAAVTMRLTEYVALNLGKNFHYAGIQFLPGMWNGNKNELVHGFVDSPYTGNLPLVALAKQVSQKSFLNSDSILSDFVKFLFENRMVIKNEIVFQILSELPDIESVADMAAVTNLSTRQLQRKLKDTTGFSPHDFLKILRLQKAFRGHYLDYFVDQSHFIHSFKNITGYTPKDFFSKFNV